MKKGSKFYYVLHENLEEVIVKDIRDEKIIYRKKGLSFDCDVKITEIGKDGFHYKTYEEALNQKEYNIAEHEKNKQKSYDKFLDFALNQTVILDVETNGVLIKEKWKDNLQSLLYEYKNKEYAIVYVHDLNKKQCITFHKRDKRL